MFPDLSLQRDFGGAIKFTVYIFCWVVFLSLYASVIVALSVNSLPEREELGFISPLLPDVMGYFVGLTVQNMFLIAVMFLSLKAKKIRLNIKNLLLILLVSPLQFIPYTFGVLSFILPAYFSMLPVQEQ